MERQPDARPVGLVAARYAPAIGGVETHVQRLAEGLRDRGLPVEVLVTDPTGELPAVETRDGLTVRRFRTPLKDEVYFLSPALGRFLWANGGRYRLLHAHGYHTLMPLMAALGARHRRVPLVVTPHYHGGGHTWFRDLLHVPYKPFGGWALRRAAVVLANSKAEQGWLERDFRGLSVTLNPNGVDLPESQPSGAARSTTLPLAAGERVLLSVGRLERYKQVDRIVGALPHLPADVRLTVVGVGPESERLAAEARDLGVADRVRLRGRVSNEELAAWYGAASAFVTLSLEESFGLTLLEGAAAGAPVLASDIPAHREVADYAPGRIRLVSADEAPEELATAITATLAVGRSADRTGWSLPTWGAMVDGVVAAYERAAPSRQEPGGARGA